MQHFWAPEILLNETFFVILALILPYISDSTKAESACNANVLFYLLIVKELNPAKYCKLSYANILHQKAPDLLTRPLIYPGLHKIGCCFSNKTKENSVCISDSGEMVKEGVCSSEENLLAAHCHHPWLVGWMYRTSTG